MAEQDQQARIRAYLAQHQTTYERPALRQKLIDDGYDPALIDAALAELDATTTGRPAYRFSAGSVYLGLIAFGLLNFLTSTFALGGLMDMGVNVLYPALIFIAITLALSGLAFWLRRPNLAAGLLAGYVIMTVLSRGSCTYLNPNASYDIALMGLIFYPLLLLCIGLIVGIHTLNSRRKRD